MNIDLTRFQKSCSCGKPHPMAVQDIWIEAGACRQLSRLLENYQQPVIICDNRTKQAALSSMADYFTAYNNVELTDTDIHANEIYVDVVDQKLRTDADILIAVGSGTIHDLTRYVAHSRNIPFISVPTAASVDGFVSTVAAMTWKGAKKTLPAVAPLYVVADTDIFAKAPYRLTASGISDLMGKYTALLDWRVSHIVTGEYFCQEIYDLEMEAVLEVERLLGDIRSGDPASLEKLMYALLLSGLAMQMIGNSRPASGAEHHVSHLWEMNIINEPVDALHGEKVSVGLLLCLEKYTAIREALKQGRYEITDNRQIETGLLQDTFGKKGLYEEILEENKGEFLESIDLDHLKASIPQLIAELEKLPDPGTIRDKLTQAGCITTMEQLGIPAELKKLTLDLCPYVRNRLTLLRLSRLIRY